MSTLVKNNMKSPNRFLNLLLGVALLTLPVAAQNSLPSDVTQRIDSIAAEALRSTGVPAASVAVVKDGLIAYVKAYGSAKLEPAIAATPDMRFSIGSVSKQFTATAILMLQE